MKNRALVAACKLIVIKEEHTVAELREAIRMLGDFADVSSFLLSAGGLNAKAPMNEKISKINKNNNGAVSALKSEDPEKYALLQKFENQLKNGEVLTDFAKLKKFASSIDPEFVPRRTRKETLKPLIAGIARKPVQEISALIGELTGNENDGESDYVKLASYIITGGSKTAGASKVSSDQGNGGKP